MVREWREDRVAGLAAEVAFWGVLSLFPLLLATAAALGLLETVAGSEVAQDAEAEVIDWLQRILTENASETVDAVEDLFASSSPGLLTVSVLAAIWAASRGFAAVIRAMDVAYDLDETRGYVRTRILAVAMALGSTLVGALMLGLLVVGPLLGSGRELAERFSLGEAFAVGWTWVRGPLGFLAIVAWAATVLHIAPNHKTPWRWDLPGAVLTTVAWGLFSVGFRIYIEVAGETNQVLGVLGGSMITLLWMFLLAVGLLLGGEFNAVLIQVGIAPIPDTPATAGGPPDAPADGAGGPEPPADAAASEPGGRTAARADPPADEPDESER